MAVARGRRSRPAYNVMGQRPRILLTYRRTPPGSGRWFRVFGHGYKLISFRPAEGESRAESSVYDPDSFPRYQIIDLSMVFITIESITMEQTNRRVPDA